MAAWQRLRQAVGVPADTPMRTSSRFASPPQAHTVARPVAVDRIAAAVSSTPLTVVVAPAGSGKTTAVAWWAAEAAPRPVIWARADRRDDDPRSLARLLLGAVDHHTAGAASRLADVLDDPGADPSRMAAGLGHDLAALGTLAGNPPALVVDDLHVLADVAALELLDRLVDELPAGAALVITSRTEPPLSLARRRVRHEVSTVGAAELRLDRAAAVALLERAGATGAVEVDDLLSFSGGWAAAVQLAAIRAATGGWSSFDVVPTAVAGDLAAFLAAEVFGELPADLRSFLLDTCVLPDLEPAACAAITDASDIAGHLRELVRRDLFVTSTGVGGALRHHDLFLSFLRDRLVAERGASHAAELRRRAAATVEPGDAVSLLLDAGDETGAARLVSDVARSRFDDGAEAVPEAWVRGFSLTTVAEWPWLRLLVGSAELRRGAMSDACATLAGVAEAMDVHGEERGGFEARLALLEAALAVGDVPTGMALLDQLDGCSLRPDDLVRIHSTRFWVHFFASDWDALSDSVGEAFTLAFGGASSAGRRALARTLACESLFVDQGPAWVASQARRLAAMLGDRGAGLAAATLEAVQAGAALLAGDTTTATDKLAVVRVVAAEHGGLGWTDLVLDRLQLALAVATGDDATVTALTGAAGALVTGSAVHHQERAMYAWADAMVALHRRRPQEVRAARDRWLGDLDPHDRPDAAITAMVLEAHLALVRDDAAHAADTLRAAADEHDRVRFGLAVGQPRLELAAMLFDAGLVDDAESVLDETMARVAGFDAPGLLGLEGPRHRPLLDHAVSRGIHVGLAQRALGVAGGPSEHPADVVGLTARELEVLRLVVAGASNRDIGTALFIGERTVKTHMTSLMRKLDVTSRTAAAARARGLGLVP